MNSKPRIIIAEDESLIRKSFILLLKQTELFNVVGEAANGRDLIDLLKKISADIVLLDIKMPVMDGLEALRIIKRRFPETAVIILSGYKDFFYMKEAISNGARGYLVKDCLPDELIKAIAHVHNKKLYLPESISLDFLNNLVYSAIPEQKFTVRESEIIKELSDGRTEKEIAQKLKISQHTVHFHRTNIYSKTKAHNLAGLLKYVKETRVFT
jgi:DNA-binding NarL/FixJ family response regulator